MSELVLFDEYPAKIRPEPKFPAAIRDPFLITGPAYISFSGGRTSGDMLARCLERGLQPDVHVLFANTGKERNETLDFVRDVQVNFGVSIRWLEYRPAGFVEVSYETASRNGEPFELLIAAEHALPNRTMRFCTMRLKLAPMRAFMLDQGYDHFTNVVGIRADEPGRVAKLFGRVQPNYEDLHVPMWQAGINHPMVLNGWKQRGFDLALGPNDSNCDLCFLMGAAERLRRMRQDLSRADWWLLQQDKTGAKWINPKSGRPSYERLVQIASSNERLPHIEDDPAEDCTCMGD